MSDPSLSPAIISQLQTLDSTLDSINTELKSLAKDLTDIIDTTSALEKRIDEALDRSDDAIIVALQKRVTRLEAREDSLRERERDLRMKERMVREERMAVLNVWKEVAASSSATTSRAVSPAELSLPVAAEQSTPTVVIPPIVMESLPSATPSQDRPESAAGAAFAWLASTRADDLSLEEIPSRMLTPPVSPDPILALDSAVYDEKADVLSGSISEGETTALPQLDIDSLVPEMDMVAAAPAAEVLDLGKGAEDERIIVETLIQEPETAVVETKDETLVSSVTSSIVVDAVPQMISGEAQEDPTTFAPVESEVQQKFSEEAITAEPEEGSKMHPTEVAESTSSHAGSVEDDPETEGYTAPALGLRSVRHGSLVRGIPMERSSPMVASPTSITRFNPNTRTPAILEHPETAVSTENTEDLLMDENTPVKSSLARIIHQFISTPPVPAKAPPTRGASPIQSFYSSIPPPKSITMSRSNSSLGKLTSPSPRNKPRATSSAIPVPLYQLGRSPSSSSAGSVASFSPDLIVTEDEGEEMFFQRGPMPSPLIERRRESMRIMNQQMVDEGFRWKVMVSYCWDDVNLPCDPRKIAQHLSDAGLSTWLDIERLDSRKAVFPQLVDGILRSDVIIICVSKAWSRSPICNKEFRLISQLKVPVLIVQIGETRPGCWKRIGRVTLQNPGIVDAIKPKNLKATLDMILSETRWLVSRTLSTPEPSPSQNTNPFAPSPSLSKLGRSSSSSSSHSSTSTLTSSHATTIVSPSPSPSPSMSRTSSKRYSGHSDLTGSALFHHFQANTPSPLSQKSSASPNDLPGVVALKRHADRGDAMSQFRLGVLSDAGIGVNPSSTPSTAQHSPAATAAFKWFSSAAERAHRDANYRLGNLFERGRGVNKDLEKAKRFYEVAFEMGDPDAGCALAGVLRELAKSGVKSAHEESRSSPPPEERWSDHAVGILERSATLGSIRSMFRLGIAMHDRKNHALAVDWFLRAAEEGDDGGAMFNLGTLSERGRGCRKSLSDAAKYYAMAADHRFDVAAAGGLEHAMASVHAVFNLGVFYEHGWGVEKDLKKCVDMYKEAATYGHRRGQFNYGVCLKKGRGTPKNLEDAVKWFIKAGEQGHPDAQFNLGNSYKYGEGVEKDLKEAARWYQKASEQGHSKAQFNLALCYDEGEGIEKNPEEAARLYKLSAEAGNAISQFYYGTALEQGRGVEPDIFEAARMYRLAADQGDPDAASSLAHCYLSGEGLPRSLKESMRWFRVAAEAGEPEAQFMLGMLLRKGPNGVVGEAIGKNGVESLLWLRRSARQGHVEALFEVGCAFESGWGVVMDFEKAGRWFARAAKAGHPKAAQRIVVGRN